MLVFQTLTNGQQHERALWVSSKDAKLLNNLLRKEKREREEEEDFRGNSLKGTKHTHLL